MTQMRIKRLWTAAAIIILTLVVWFVLTAPRVRDSVRPPPSIPVVATDTPVVALRDAFRKGVHTLSGSVTASDACMNATAEASFVGA